jgi:hypothetical protein
MGYCQFKQKNLAGRGSRSKRDQTTALTPLLHRLSRPQSRELVMPSKDRSAKFCFTELIVHARGVRIKARTFDPALIMAR